MSEHSAPFLIRVEHEDTVDSLRERIRLKLCVQPEDFKSWDLSVWQPSGAGLMSLQDQDMEKIAPFARVCPTFCFTLFLRILCLDLDAESPA